MTEQTDKRNIVCHAYGERCHGCAHSRGEAAVCEYAVPKTDPPAAAIRGGRGRMKFPFRVLSARRVRELEAAERQQDLPFIRGAIQDAIDELGEQIHEHRLCHATPSSRYQHIPDAEEREYYAHLVTLRVNLLTTLFVLGGSTS